MTQMRDDEFDEFTGRLQEIQTTIESPAATLSVHLDVNEFLSNGGSETDLFELIGKLRDLFNGAPDRLG